MKKRLLVILTFALLLVAGMVYSDEPKPPDACCANGQVCCVGTVDCEYWHEHEQLVSGWWICCNASGLYTGDECEPNPTGN